MHSIMLSKHDRFMRATSSRWNTGRSVLQCDHTL